MSFDAVVFAVANAAKIPIGAMLRGTGDGAKWFPCDGTRKLKADYPKAYDTIVKTYNKFAYDYTNTSNLAFGPGCSWGSHRQIVQNGKTFRGQVFKYQTGSSVTATTWDGSTAQMYYQNFWSFFGVNAADNTEAVGNIPNDLRLTTSVGGNATPYSTQQGLDGTAITNYPCQQIGMTFDPASNRYVILGQNVAHYQAPSSVSTGGYIASFSNTWGDPKMRVGATGDVGFGSGGFASSDSQIKAFGGALYAFQTSHSLASGAFKSTDNGNNWSALTMTGTARSASKVEVFAGKMYAINNTTTNVLSVTSDGSAWSNTPTFNASGPTLTNLKVVNGLLCMWGKTAGYLTSFWTTPDGVTFTKRDIPAGFEIADIGYVNGLYVVVCETTQAAAPSIQMTDTGAYFTSSNLTAWTKRQFPGSIPFFRDYSSYSAIPGLLANNSAGTILCALPSGTSSKYLLRTTDGINWTFQKYSDVPGAKFFGYTDQRRRYIVCLNDHFFIYAAQARFDSNDSTYFGMQYMKVSKDALYWGVEGSAHAAIPCGYTRGQYFTQSFKPSDNTSLSMLWTSVSSTYWYGELQRDRNGDRIGVVPGVQGDYNNGVPSSCVGGGFTWLMEDEMVFKVSQNGSYGYTFTPVFMIANTGLTTAQDPAYRVMYAHGKLVFYGQTQTFNSTWPILIYDIAGNTWNAVTPSGCVRDMAIGPTNKVQYLVQGGTHFQLDVSTGTITAGPVVANLPTNNANSISAANWNGSVYAILTSTKQVYYSSVWNTGTNWSVSIFDNGTASSNVWARLITVGGAFFVAYGASTAWYRSTTGTGWTSFSVTPSVTVIATTTYQYQEGITYDSDGSAWLVLPASSNQYSFVVKFPSTGLSADVVTYNTNDYSAYTKPAVRTLFGCASVGTDLVLFSLMNSSPCGSVDYSVIPKTLTGNKLYVGSTISWSTTPNWQPVSSYSDLLLKTQYSTNFGLMRMSNDYSFDAVSEYNVVNSFQVGHCSGRPMILKTDRNAVLFPNSLTPNTLTTVATNAPVAGSSADLSFVSTKYGLVMFSTFYGGATAASGVQFYFTTDGIDWQHTANFEGYTVSTGSASFLQSYNSDDILVPLTRKSDAATLVADFAHSPDGGKSWYLLNSNFDSGNFVSNFPVTKPVLSATAFAANPANQLFKDELGKLWFAQPEQTSKTRLYLDVDALGFYMPQYPGFMMKIK